MSIRRLLGLALLILGLFAASGCAVQSLTSAPLALRSGATPASLELRPALAVFERRDEQRLEIYLTDLSRADLERPIDELSGSIVRIERFFAPRAGRTPLDSTSSNASVRWAVMAHGAVGVYEGGGMLFVDQSILTGGAVRGELRGGTLRLASRSAGFDDRLGSVAADGGFPLRDNAAQARALARLFERAARRAQPMQPTDGGAPGADG